MQNKSLVELLNDIEQELLRLGYSEGSMKFYRRHWHLLLQFAAERNETVFSEQLGVDFVEKQFHLFEKDLNRTLLRSDVQKLRIVKMIGYFQLHRTILRRYNRNKTILTDPYFITINNQFKTYCEEKEYSQATTAGYVNQAARFVDYIVSHGATDCQAISLSLIHAYIKTWAGYTHATAGQNIICMRAFFRFLLETGKVQTDFAVKTPMIQARQQTHIPSVWTKDELTKLIAAIDRGNPKGKRDYAIILLACCLGVRSMDIKHLQMENFHWKEKQLVFTQSKTGNPLILPLTPEVGWAVIDYLKHGRPKIDGPYVFVKHMAPFGPFSDADHLNQLIKTYMKLAHLPTLNKKRGMHSLRHTMASLLLENDTPLFTISDILGHTDTDSTAVYLKVGVQKLKECALDFGEGQDHA